MPPSLAANRSDRTAIVRDPVYQQLNELLQGLIRRGDFKPGQQFLTERQVGEQFGVSRVTANKALSHLVVEGVLEFRKGVGTFVRAGVLNHDLQSLISFTRKANEAGQRPSTRVLTFESVRADHLPSAVRESLTLENDAPVWSFSRLRLADGVPVILERRHVPAAVCPRLTARKLEGSFYSLLTDSYGVEIVSAEEQIRAVNLSRTEAGMLQVTEGAAALQLTATGFSRIPLWHEVTLYLGSHYEFLNSIGNLGRGQAARMGIRNARIIRNGTSPTPVQSAGKRTPGKKQL